MALPFGSTLEEKVYRGLLAIGWRADQIEAQSAFAGGRTKPGGQVIDFILYRPTPLPVYVNGEYWHRDRGEDFIEEMEVADEYGVLPVVIWGDECETWEQQQATLLRKIGRP